MLKKLGWPLEVILDMCKDLQGSRACKSWYE